MYATAYSSPPARCVPCAGPLRPAATTSPAPIVCGPPRSRRSSFGACWKICARSRRALGRATAGGLRGGLKRPSTSWTARPSGWWPIAWTGLNTGGAKRRQSVICGWTWPRCFRVLHSSNRPNLCALCVLSRQSTMLPRFVIVESASGSDTARAPQVCVDMKARKCTPALPRAA